MEDDLSSTGGNKGGEGNAFQTTLHYSYGSRWHNSDKDDAYEHE